ncbi:DUF2169 family type VI secretion system accessory protein [Variovorax sp. LT1R20]|uniref:DUF2169 family type VI secretion system accessory protein n=1 Tax=Variovorax sp. LT1R20 TaxID=3443729 RepID=UPI003F46B767
MKTVKPLRLSLITRPFLRDGRQRLGVTLMGMVSMGEAPVLLPEPEFWKVAAEELGPTGAIDLGMPKVCAEFLATGHAYTHHQKEKTACAVALRVGELTRQLLVFGDRFWLDGQATAPQPFESMRLDWTRAYGGPSFVENPAGIGHAHETVNGLTVQRVPNIENPHRRLDRPDREVEPACFDAIHLARPSRMRLIGRHYDAHWRDNLFPGFSEDMDWHFFNAAPPEQRWTGRDSIPSGTPYEIWNMHPTQPLQSGRLPDWRARAFIARKTGTGRDPEHFDEVPMRHTTAWFFPHHAQVALIYHGEIDIAEDDADDVTHVMPAIERAGEPQRPIAHYFEILQRRCHPETGALYAACDDELLPLEAIGPWLDTLDDAEESALVRNMRERGDRLREDMMHKAREAGHDPRLLRERPLPEPFRKAPTLAELPAFIERTRIFAQDQRRKLEEGRQELQRLGRRNAVESRKVGFDTGDLVESIDRATTKGPPSIDAQGALRGMFGIAQSTGTAPLPPAQQREFAQVVEKGQRGLLDMYRVGAQHQSAADAMSAERAAEARRRVQEVMATTRDLSEMDLTGADLSGMDLRGARLHRTLFENANLEDARLDGADATEAVLVRAHLSRASLAGCVLHRANLSLAQCLHTVFAGAHLHETAVEKARFEACDFGGAELEHLTFLGIHVERCSFDEARFAYVTFIEQSNLRDCSFRGAVLHKVGLISCVAARLDFTRAQLEACAWAHTPGDDGIVFREATLRTTCFVGTSSLRNADFEGATLVQCGLREMALDGTRFVRATLDTCDFSACSFTGADLSAADAPESLFIRCDFTHAALRGANLMHASLQKARLIGTDLREANLFRADVSQALIDHVTETRGAYLEQAKTLPRRAADPVR